MRGEFDPARGSSKRRLRDSRLVFDLLTDLLMSSLGRFSEGAKETRSASDPEGCPVVLHDGCGEAISASVESSVDLRLRGPSGCGW